MPGNHKMNWSLLAKKLAGETSAAENEAVNSWMARNAKNRELFGKLKSDWKIMNGMNRDFDVDQAWNKLHNRISGGKKGQLINGRQAGISLMRRHWPLVQIAASLMLLALLGLSADYLIKRSKVVVVRTASTEVSRTILLPDGSKVNMNAESRLQYPKVFDRKAREIQLKGEAFFEVSPDKSKPFIIHAEQAEIRVVGTSFNIRTKKNRKVEVFVSTGVVELYQPENISNKVILHPGDIGTFDHNKVYAEKSKNENSIAWKTGNMDFQETKVSEAIDVLNRMYRVNIICLDEAARNRQTTGKYVYPDEPLDTILAIFCRQNDLNVKKSGDIIYLSR